LLVVNQLKKSINNGNLVVEIKIGEWIGRIKQKYPSDMAVFSWKLVESWDRSIPVINKNEL
jgi:hypothetical protein